MDLLTFVPQVADFNGAYTYLKQCRVIIAQPPVCSHHLCGRQMTLVRDLSLINDGCNWRCPKKHEKKSIRDGCYFANSNLSRSKIALLVYPWSNRLPGQTVANLCDLSQERIVQWFSWFQDACSHELVNNPVLVGGSGLVMEIDEILFVKAKYNRGHALLAPQRWVFGMYDVQTKKAVMVFMNDRSAATLIPLIQQYVLPGTQIASDMWAAYNGIAQLPVVPPYTQVTVNHHQKFVDPVTGACTNRVEAMWKRAKAKFKEMNGTEEHMVAGYLDEFMWRQVHGANTLNDFWATIDVNNRWW